MEDNTMSMKNAGLVDNVVMANLSSMYANVSYYGMGAYSLKYDNTYLSSSSPRFDTLSMVVIEDRLLELQTRAYYESYGREETAVAEEVRYQIKRVRYHIREVLLEVYER